MRINNCTIALQHFFSTAKGSPSKLGAFLEGKSKFLSQLSHQCTQTKPPQDQLIDLIQEMGSSLSPSSLGTYPYKANPWENAQIAADEAFTIREMLACNMHLGHAVSKGSRRMNAFIWGEREGIHILDLEKTLYHLRKAAAACKELASKGANILWVAANPAFERLVYQTAVDCGQFYLNGPWTRGLIANREFLLGDLKYCPDLVIVLDHGSNPVPAYEAYRKLVPCIAICDSDSDPSEVTWPIPCNDDAYDSVKLVVEMLKRACLAGNKLRQK